MHVKANVFNIERASINDGNGIRTVVYLKGCPLSCKWCHNPEGICYKSEIAHYKSKCILCGTCENVCPNNCYRVIEGSLVKSYKECINCYKCVDECPTNALNVFGKNMSTEEVMEEILKDTEYYRISNGGVTFSGGECLSQIDFMEEILNFCKLYNINTLVESSFYVPWDNIKKVEPITDTFFVDIKHMNSDIHKKYTGVGNELILKNIKKASSFNNKINLRIPLIPGVNDDDENLLNSFDFALKYGFNHITLLLYNSLGKIKYTALDKHFFVPLEEEYNKEELFKKCTSLNNRISCENFFISE